MDMLGFDQYHRPSVCKECGGAMIFRGVGEYRCEDCEALEYDDYGKVRLYIETHKGATAAEIEDATGVKQRTIRQMLKDDRLEVAKDSRAFLQCEICGVNIRSGRYCSQCESNHKRSMDDRQRAEKIKQLKGHGMNTGKGEDGEKRFRRDR